MKCYIHLKSENVKIEKEGAKAKIFEFLKSWISKLQNGQRMNSPLIGQPPLKSKIF